MAKRRSPAEPESRNYDPFDADIEDLSLDDLNVDDLRVEDVPDEPILLPDEDMASGAALSPVQVIVGLIQVILLGAVFFALMAAIGFGAVFAGQRLGIVPTRSAGESGPTVAILPTEAPPEVVVVPTATPLPTVTADPGCPQAETWWNSQQIQSTYTYFTEQVVEEARNTNNISALTERMNIYRGTAENFPSDPCISDAKAALLKAFDSTIAVARATNARDEAALAQQQPAEAQAYDDLAEALREVGVNLVLPTTSG